MKKIILTLSSIMIGLISEAATVRGILYDPTFNEGEPYATVRVFNLNSDKPLTTVLTDSKGNFLVDTDKGGNFRFEFSAIGKETIIREISMSDDENLDLGEIIMKEDAQNLDEVEVVGRRPLVQMSADEMTYNVSSDSDSRTFSLLEMLRKVPMVTVDGEDNITVNGSSNFQVYVDGKPSLLFSGNPSQIFKSMPASAVLKVEVITNPGARYDAEGVGGVLNLVMNKEVGGATGDMKGYNVSASLRGGNRGLGGNIYASGQVGKMSASLNLIHNDMRPGSTSFSNVTTQGNTTTGTNSKTKLHVPFSMGNLSLEYSIDSLTTMGASFALNRLSAGTKGISTTDIIHAGNNTLSYFTVGDNDILRQGINGSVNLSRSFGAGRRNLFQVTYQISHETQNTLSDNDFNVTLPDGMVMPDRKSDSKARTTEQILVADLTSKFNDNNTLSVGLKGSFRSATADNSYFVDADYDSDGSVIYKNDNKIGAAYGEYSFRNTQFSAKAGIRYEHTWHGVKYRMSNIDDYSDNYGNLVPSASISYNLTQGSNLGLTYNMRISRPGISYLNPYVNQSDPTQITYGNPDLGVEKTHNVSLVYNLFKSNFMFNATLSNAYTGNGIEQYSFMEDGVLNTTYGNVVKRTTTTLNAYMNWQIGSKTRLFINGDVSYLDIRSNQLNASNSGLQGNIMLGLQQQLPGEISSNVFLVGSSKSRTLQGWSTGFQMIGLNLSKSFLDDRLGVSLGVNSGLSKGGKIKMDTYTETPVFTNITKIRVSIASVNLGVTFKFGSSSKIKEVKSNFINNDYIDRSSEAETITNTGNI